MERLPSDLLNLKREALFQSKTSIYISTVFVIEKIMTAVDGYVSRDWTRNVTPNRKISNIDNFFYFADPSQTCEQLTCLGWICEVLQVLRETPSMDCKDELPVSSETLYHRECSEELFQLIPYSLFKMFRCILSLPKKKWLALYVGARVSFLLLWLKTSIT